MHKKVFILWFLILSLLIGCQNTQEDAVKESADVSGYTQTLYENAKVWGIGEKITAYVSNDRSYDWYIDQADTGTHAGDNCGPSSVEMVAKWYDSKTNANAEKLRGSTKPLGGWWNNEDLSTQLTKLDIPHHWLVLEDRYTLMGIIDSGSIAIVINTMGEIPYQSDEEARTGRFYSFDSGHFLVIKGYLIADGKLYFEVYDPNNWSMVYENGEPKGKNRYYLAEHLLKSIEVWYNEVLVVPSATK